MPWLRCSRPRPSAGQPQTGVDVAAMGLKFGFQLETLGKEAQPLHRPLRKLWIRPRRIWC